MRHWFTLTIILILATALPAQTQESEFGKPHEKAPEEIGQMAFLIGKWKLTTWFTLPDGSRKESSAFLTARYCLNGFGIEAESHYPAEGGFPDFFSRAVYVYNKRLGKWVGTGINNLGNRKQFEVSFKDGKMISIQSGMLFEGRKGINRITYSEMEKASFKLIHEHSPDDGETWQEPAFGYTAERIN